jgi:predicted O-linked N-acetylglucosamine transferase (SPINDLY family)
MRSIEEAFGIALRQHQAGHCAEAAAAYQEILRQEPGHAGAWHLLGVVHQQRGDFCQAVQCIAKAISLDSPKAIYHNNLGVSLRSLGRLEEAAAACRQALTINPQYPDALSYLAVALQELGQEEEPLKLLQEALRIQPSHADALFNLANLYQSLGRAGEAIGLYRKAIAIQPNRVGAHNNLGNALLAARRAGEAAASYQEAIRLEPEYAEAHLNLAAAYAQQEMVQEAERCWQEACRLRPDKPLWEMRSAGRCPVVFSSVEEQDRYRAELERKLDVYRQIPLGVRWEDLARDGFIPSFNLKHHGRYDRRLKEKFAALFEPLFRSERPRVRRGKKPRIGFLVTRQHEGGFLRAMGGIAEHLDRERFEVVVLCSRACLEACWAGMPRVDVQWVPFPDDLRRAVERVRAAQCDLLYYRQIGIDHLNYFIPFTRPAPVQCTCWGSHSTTGISAVDYFVSSRLTEPEGAEEHYTEKLYCLPTLPEYQRRMSAPAPARPGDFGLPEDRHLYLCPGRTAKFHPDHDQLLRAVLEADPEGLVVLVKGSYEHEAPLLSARLERTLAGLVDRVVFLAQQTPADFRRLLSVGNVMLDTWHYSASLMAYDAFSVALPIVTLPDGFNVGRVTMGLYRKMGLEHLVAWTPEEYVALAVRLGTDREYRESVRAQIRTQSEVLYEDRELVREHERFFEQALACADETAECW